MTRLHRRERKTGILAVYVPMTSSPLPGGSTWDEKKGNIHYDEDEWGSFYLRISCRTNEKLPKACIFTLSAAQVRIYHETKWTFEHRYGPAGARKYGCAWPYKRSDQFDKDNQCEQRDRHRHMFLGNARKSVPCFLACKKQDRGPRYINFYINSYSRLGCIMQMAIVVL